MSTVLDEALTSRCFRESNQIIEDMVLLIRLVLSDEYSGKLLLAS